jgi:hypothetical protein
MYGVVSLGKNSAGLSIYSGRAQGLAPRAYVITPLHGNVITLTWGFYDGSINLNGLPVSATGTYSVPTFSYYHSLSFFGRSANVLASLPYAVGNFQGTAPGAEAHAYRSGLVDSVFRFSVNLRNHPPREPGRMTHFDRRKHPYSWP